MLFFAHFLTTISSGMFSRHLLSKKNQAIMSLNSLYDHMTQNKVKTKHLALVAKSQEV